jgi:large subunit ribosomal protein L24
MAAKIKKGDTVIVTVGKDKGKEGKVLEVRPSEDRIVVQGLNMIARHTRPSQNQAGGIVRREAPLHMSNVMLKDPKTGEPTRVGFKIEKDRKVRFAKRSGEVIDG